MDSKLCDELVAILQNYVGEAGASEGAVDVLNRKLAELAEAKGYLQKLMERVGMCPICHNDGGFHFSECKVAAFLKRGGK